MTALKVKILIKLFYVSTINFTINTNLKYARTIFSYTCFNHIHLNNFKTSNNKKEIKFSDEYFYVNFTTEENR